MTQQVDVTIYTTPFCGYCIMAKRLLKSRNVEYEEIDTQGQAELRRWLFKASGQSTVPQIFIDQQSIGGYTELQMLDRQKLLLPLLYPTESSTS